MKLIILNFETGEVFIYNNISLNDNQDIEEYISDTLDYSLDNIQYMCTKADLTIKVI